jgi:hypothetical protein
MKRKTALTKKRTTIKSVLRLPDIEHAKAAVLGANSGFDQPSMIALVSSRILQLGAWLWQGCHPGVISWWLASKISEHCTHTSHVTCQCKSALS